MLTRWRLGGVVFFWGGGGVRGWYCVDWIWGRGGGKCKFNFDKMQFVENG